MVVTRTIEYEIDDYLGRDLIDNTFDDDEYMIAVDDNGNTISYYDLDVKNRIIFLEEFQKQINIAIAEEIDILKNNLKTAAATE